MLMAYISQQLAMQYSAKILDTHKFEQLSIVIDI